ACTLETMQERLLKIKVRIEQQATVLDMLMSDEEIHDELLDEILADQEEELMTADTDVSGYEQSPDTVKFELEKLKSEIAELGDFISWARSLGIDTKAKALLGALEIGFEALEQMGAAKKVVIFTESRRTQSW